MWVIQKSFLKDLDHEAQVEKSLWRSDCSLWVFHGGAALSRDRGHNSGERSHLTSWAPGSKSASQAGGKGQAHRGSCCYWRRGGNGGHKVRLCAPALGRELASMTFDV